MTNKQNDKQTDINGQKTGWGTSIQMDRQKRKKEDRQIDRKK
jgi:hypothetical protein